MTAGATTRPTVPTTSRSASPTTPDTKRSGATTRLYDIVGVLGWNDQPVVRGQGSAIFLHIARPDYTPTQGCVALSLPDLLATLAAGLSAIRVDPI